MLPKILIVITARQYFMMALIYPRLDPYRLPPSGRLNMALIMLILLPAALSGYAMASDPSQDQSAGPLLDALSCQYNCSGDDPLSSLEELLRGQAQLLTGFAILLDKTNRTTDESIDFLDSFEDLLRRQAGLYSGFERLLKSQWYNLNCEQQRIFLDSFEDLLHREVRLYARFNSSLEQIWPSLPGEEKVKLLASFEDLLRRQADLFKSFEELYMMSQGGLTLEKAVNKSCICRPGEAVEYSFTVKNWYNQTIANVSIVDDHLGLIVEDVTLGPYEEKTFYKIAHLEGTTCNTAKARGEGPCGEMLLDESNTVCVTLCPVSGNNSASLVVGRQIAFSSGSDPPVAFNNLEIKKSQMVEAIKQNNNQSIWLGYQKAASISNPKSGSESSNNRRIVANQG